MKHSTSKEHQRISPTKVREWRRWGPYLSERQWGTVREDYSRDGEAWEYFTFDQAKSRSYRWGEDGIAGISDEDQLLCFSFAFWNGADAILKERLFGLANGEGNHGEDVKEVYYYLDNLPSHRYMRMLYRYPQAAFPYNRLRQENAARDRKAAEFELEDCGVFAEGRFFDVFVEYLKLDTHDIIACVRVHNRAAEPAQLDIIPQLWFRNTWSWDPSTQKPRLFLEDPQCITAEHPQLGTYHLQFQDAPEVLFCDNETNAPLLFGTPSESRYFKDGLHRYIVERAREACHAEGGTKVGLRYSLSVVPDKVTDIWLRLSKRKVKQPFRLVEKQLAAGRAEADAFYDEVQRGIEDPDLRNIQRQAFAGLLWSKQFYFYDVERWLAGDPGQPKPPASRLTGRNVHWLHLRNHDILSMPDSWEYPWYAAWDLAFHTLPLAQIDPEFAKQQLILMTREWYMHPNGQLPAYEWKFSDVNPPVHAWAAWRVYQIDRKQNNGRADRAFLERVFHKLLLNFTWWVNRKDSAGRNVFEGGFLGLDNIGVFDRSQPLPIGGSIHQSDATSWMAMYSLNLMRIALELALENPVYQDIASKFFEHFLRIAEAMTNIAGEGIGLWDEDDKFYYDVLEAPNGQTLPLKLRSMVGLIPLFAVETIEPETLERLPEFAKRLEWFLENRPELAALVSRWNEPGRGERRLLSLLRGHRFKKILKRMLDVNEFLSDYGVRSLSKAHEREPYAFRYDGQQFDVSYQPGESDSPMFGGNSNWRGPIWFPVNYLIIESLQKFHHYYGDDFRVECPSNSGKYTSILEVAEELSRRLITLFTVAENGERPALAGIAKDQHQEHFRDHLLFHEYFHGDSGRGLGAAHQTGWTALVAKLIQPRQNQSDKQQRFQRDCHTC